VIVVRSGIGKVLASITTSLLIQQYGVNMVINTGSAGGIGDGLQVGDLVISDKVAYFDVDVTGFGYEYGQLPGGIVYFSSFKMKNNRNSHVSTDVFFSFHDKLVLTKRTVFCHYKRRHLCLKFSTPWQQNTIPLNGSR